MLGLCILQLVIQNRIDKVMNFIGRHTNSWHIEMFHTKFIYWPYVTKCMDFVF